MISIDRKLLTSLLQVDTCIDWTKPINFLLSSTEEDIITVDQSYIDQLNTNGTWYQIHKVLTSDVQGLDVQYPQEALDFVRNLFTSCPRVDNRWYNPEGKWCFEVYISNKIEYFFFSYYRFYDILVKKYGCNNLQISRLISIMLNDEQELKGLTPHLFPHRSSP